MNKYKLLILVVTTIACIHSSAQEIEILKTNIEKSKAEGNKIELAENYNKLGHALWQKGELQEAASCFLESMAINKALGNKNAQRILNEYLGLVYLEKEDYPEAIKYFEVSLQDNLAQKRWPEAISQYYNIASAYQMMKDYRTSNEYAQKALDKAIEINNLESAKSCNLMLAENYEKLGENEKSATHFSNYSMLSKHIQQAQLKKLESENIQIQNEKQNLQAEKTQIQTEKQKIQTEKQQIEENLKSTEEKVKEATAEIQLRELQQKELERQHQSRIRYFVSIIGFIFIILILFFIQSQQRKKVNRKLKEQNSEIEAQKVEIEKQRDLANKQRKKLMSSIQYARRIQSAVIPRQETLINHFRDNFILYYPRDIVSGDFYWFAQKENFFIIAAADCTGHGVPGAFMSMLGVAYLNEIVNKISVNIHINALEADEILNQLREKVISSLHQSENKREPKDGMDIALCIVDFDSMKVQFSGAYNPLVIIRKGELLEFKGDKMPVSFHRNKDVPFTRHDVDLYPNDCLYIFSDGFIDQFGGTAKRKYLLKQFKAKLLEIYAKPMLEQRDVLEQEFNLWKGENEQVDDVLVIGLRFLNEADPRKQEWKDKTILIAEDTDINYFLLVEVLKKTKIKMIRVTNGKEAVDYIKHTRVDLILMDINMPNMNGYEATQIIKSLNKDIPVIIQTAIQINGRKKSIEMGADDFISKPIDLKTFMDKLSRFLN